MGFLIFLMIQGAVVVGFAANNVTGVGGKPTETQIFHFGRETGAGDFPNSDRNVDQGKSECGHI